MFCVALVGLPDEIYTKPTVIFAHRNILFVIIKNCTKQMWDVGTYLIIHGRLQLKQVC